MHKPIDNPVKVEAKADLTHAADTAADMVNATHKGVGKVVYALCGPLLEERIGKAKRIAAQADKDALDILTGKKQYNPKIDEIISIAEVSDIDALCAELERVNSSCKAKRLAASIMTAATEIKQIPQDEIATEPLNQTFFNHWREEAELIDDEDLRAWWSRLLVEEVRKPNSISPRTLDVAKKMSRNEAEAFQLICRCIWNNFVITTEYDAPLNCDYPEMLSIQDAGLVCNSSCNCNIAGEKHISPLGKPVTTLSFPRCKLIIAIELDSCRLHGNLLTCAGQELYRILPHRQNLKDLILIAKLLTRLYVNVPVGIYKVPFMLDDKIENIKYSEFLTPDNCLWSHPRKQTGGEIR